ncbi:hybrid sensor histidine kinase/response regulator [Alteromonas sp. 14N.309.X.WAT.G.H12]|uniref:hybrid sensor histidine kinase/response regulator n=1 Tax=Alteromonas sp. 14N.309.X.WAT.G.H12 TaxID=3120824 RepID=UPI002FD09C4C
MKILLIEDNQDHRELIEEYCSHAFGNDCDILSFDKLKSGLDALDTTSFDIALIDLSLPDSCAEDTELALENLDTHIPIIVLTSLNDEMLGQNLIQKGAQDFLPKDSLNSALLHRIINYSIERKKGQFSLEQRAIDQQTFCISLSHDFKAPIRNISQLTKILKSRLEEKNSFEEGDNLLFSKIDERLSTMNRLIDGLYNYILTEELHPAPDNSVDLNNIISELEQLLTNVNGKNVTIKYGELPVIKGNDTQIYLLLQNILENAIKFCRVDPVIIITSKSDESSTFSGLFRHKITISDNGIGIDKQYLKDVFNPFRKLHSDSDYPGSGLGLSVVERIIYNHGGKIWIDSDKNKGTSITLAFP